MERLAGAKVMLASGASSQCQQKSSLNGVALDRVRCRLSSFSLSPRPVSCRHFQQNSFRLQVRIPPAWFVAFRKTWKASLSITPLIIAGRNLRVMITLKRFVRSNAGDMWSREESSSVNSPAEAAHVIWAKISASIRKSVCASHCCQLGTGIRLSRLCCRWIGRLCNSWGTHVRLFFC